MERNDRTTGDRADRILNRDDDPAEQGQTGDHDQMSERDGPGAVRNQQKQPHLRTEDSPRRSER